MKQSNLVSIKDIPFGYSINGNFANWKARYTKALGDMIYDRFSAPIKHLYHTKSGYSIVIFAEMHPESDLLRQLDVIEKGCREKLEHRKQIFEFEQRRFNDRLKINQYSLF